MKLPFLKELIVTEYDLDSEGVENIDSVEGTRFSDYILKRHRIYICFPNSDFYIGQEISKTKDMDDKIYEKELQYCKENMLKKAELYSWWLLVNDLELSERTYDKFHYTGSDKIMDEIREYLIKKALDFDYDCKYHYLIRNNTI